MERLNLQATFLGTTSLLFSDGKTCLLTDGFFSRPPLWRVALGRIAPDRTAIERGMTRAGITRLDAVLVSHSHYDHALDAPEVARLGGALLAGSPSSAHVARGWGLAEEQIRVVQSGDSLTFGAFRVSFLPSTHALPNLEAGTIDRPLVPPARASAYKDGGCFSLLIEHPAGSLLLQSSAGFIPNGLAGVHADAALLSLAMLGRRSPRYRLAYFEQVAGLTGARVVYPIHHDDFTRPLGDKVTFLPRWLDNTAEALRSLEDWAAQRGVQVSHLPPWQAMPLCTAEPVHALTPKIQSFLPLT
jgi:L-ascorbate metabolism protein UlaG (beta-lactamase superfamily)